MFDKLKSELERQMVFIFSCVAKILSVLLSAVFWLQLSDNCSTQGMVFFIALGMLFEGTKFISFSKLVQLFQAKRYFIAMLVAPFCLLFISVSLFCSISVMSQQINTRQQTAMEQDARYLNQQRAIKIQEDKIIVLQNISAKDTELGYRERARATIAQLAHEQVTLNNLYNEAAQIKNNHAKKSTLFNLGPIFSKIIILLLGSMLEICALLLACFDRTRVCSPKRTRDCTRDRTPNCTRDCTPKRTPNCTREKRTPDSTLVCSQKRTRDCTREERTRSAKSSSAPTLTLVNSASLVRSMNTNYPSANLEEHAWELIRNSQMRATTRALRSQFRIGSAKACAILRGLTNQNLLEMRGNRYAIAS